MKKNVFIQKNQDQDKLIGRPIRLNRKVLVKNQKDCAEVLFFGDLHYGHPQCQVKKAKAMLDWALDNNVNVLLMGDLLECGLKESVGDSVYQQKLNPQEQMEEVVELLTPLAKKGLILGLHEGNHEYRITKTTGINISKIMVRLLNVSYLGYSCWNSFIVDGQKYSIYSTHGASGARFKHTKLKSVMDLAQWIDADCIVQGHVHGLAAEPIVKQSVDFRNKQVAEKECYVVLSGSYLGWDRSYAQMFNYPITKTGSPKGTFYSSKHDIHFRL